ASQTFTIAVNDVNEFAVTTPVDSNATTNTRDKNAHNSTVDALTAFAKDNDATNNAVTYSLTDNAGGRFAIDANTGVVTVAAAIDREADAASLIYTLSLHDALPISASQTFTIAVNDVNEFAVTTPVDS